MLILLGLGRAGFSQVGYDVKNLEINDRFDDFGPQVWKNYLVFCSERQVKVFLVNYKDFKTKRGVTNIVKSEIRNDTVYDTPEIFSKSILSNHHDGPVSFTSDGSKIYYSRPLDISSKAKIRKNDSLKLGIFSAEYVKGAWVDVRPLSINNTRYNVSFPAIAPDESFIVFVSDLPGGFGQSDLFISQNIKGTWSEPINLGPIINTKGKEYFPFIHYNGDLYYASNGKGEDGRTDFDIYVCPFNGKSWEDPVRLAEPFNSTFDDYSFYINFSKRQGYFSSNREGQFDIFHFEKNTPENYECSPQIEESFCFELPAVENSDLDGLPFEYTYVLNDEVMLGNQNQSYCFPEEGKYNIRLSILDTLANKLVFDKEKFEFLIERVRQPFIHVADSLPLDRWVEFDTKGTYLPRVKRNEYVWDFGDNTSESGETVRHFYSSSGEYKVTLTIFAEPIGKVVPRYCSFKKVYVDGQRTVVEETPFLKPMDVAGFVRFADYTPLPDNLYYSNLLGEYDQVKMSHLITSKSKIPLNDELFKDLDTTRMHVFQSNNDEFNYYYGSSFSMKDAYRDLVQSRSAGFYDATIKNLKNAKLNSEEFYIDETEDGGIGFSIVLKKSNNKIENYHDEFSEIEAMGNEVFEVEVPGEGYYYVTGNEKDINDAMSIYEELKQNGAKSIRVKDFSAKSVVSALSRKAENISTTQYMIELFRTDDYIDLNDSLFSLLDKQKIIAIRQADRKIAYFVSGGENLLSAQTALRQIREKGFAFSTITNFKYEKLSDDGYFLSTINDEEFSYIITFETKYEPLDYKSAFAKTLMGYTIVEKYNPLTGKYQYKLDVGKELAEAIMLSNDMKNDSITILSVDKLNYDPLTDDEFFIVPLQEGANQLIIVLGRFDEKQNIYKTFSNVRSFENIREIYNAQSGEYTYIIGGFESLDQAHTVLQSVKNSGLSSVYIQRFIYKPLAADQFVLEEVNEELELYRISLVRGEVAINSGDPMFDKYREYGPLINIYDQESNEYVVALGNTRNLPKALTNYGAIIEVLNDSAKIEKYIYSSYDQDRFAIREIDKKDEYYAIELFKTDQLLKDDDDLLRKLRRKYPIIVKFDPITNKYGYYIANINNLEGARKYREYAIQDGFADALIVTIVYETLAQDDFYIVPIEEEQFDYVITVLRSKTPVDLNDDYFDDLPEDLKLELIYNKQTGFYNYVIRSQGDIHKTNRMLGRIKESGYHFAHIDKVQYSPLAPDEFVLIPIEDGGEEYAITLIRTKEKMGINHPDFDEIKKWGEIKEYYDSYTAEYIYSFAKASGFKQAFSNYTRAKDFGFNEAEIEKFVYSELNPSHFYLETMEHYDDLFTIILAQSEERINKSEFEELRNRGFEVREKYMASRGLWVYSLSMTRNIAEAENLASLAKESGFENARLTRFIYSPLSTDYYYLESIDNDEEIFMIVLAESKEKLDPENGSIFANITGKYPIEEVYDEENQIYKYYIGKSIKEFKYAEALKKELIALGYSNALIVQYKYSALHFDEFYLQYVNDSGEVVFVLKENLSLKSLLVYFGFDQYYLAKIYRDQIDEMIEQSKGVNYKIVLEGRTDDIGEEQYNIWLSKRRAEAVKKYMVKKGIHSDRITIVPKGETDPLVSNNSIENRRKNRSVNIIPGNG